MAKILSIDPSGTGTSGLCLISDNLVEFQQFQGKEWKEHYDYIQQLVTEKQPNLIIYEDTNYIHKKTKDGLSLFRLLGAIECLKVEQVKSVNVLKVKEMTKKLLKGTVKLENLEYKVDEVKAGCLKEKELVFIV